MSCDLMVLGWKKGGRVDDAQRYGFFFFGDLCDEVFGVVLKKKEMDGKRCRLFC